MSRKKKPEPWRKVEELRSLISQLEGFINFWRDKTYEEALRTFSFGAPHIFEIQENLEEISFLDMKWRARQKGFLQFLSPRGLLLSYHFFPPRVFWGGKHKSLPLGEKDKQFLNSKTLSEALSKYKEWVVTKKKNHPKKRDPVKAMSFIRVETLTFEEGCKRARERNGRRVMVLVKNPKCVHCGLEGSFWALEKDNGGGRHLNLFGVDEEGDEVMLTMDHILPKSKGGKNNPENLQTLCFPCNYKKADFVPEVES